MTARSRADGVHHVGDRRWITGDVDEHLRGRVRSSRSWCRRRVLRGRHAHPCPSHRRERARDQPCRLDPVEGYVDGWFACSRQDGSECAPHLDSRALLGRRRRVRCRDRGRARRGRQRDLTSHLALHDLDGCGQLLRRSVPVLRRHPWVQHGALSPGIRSGTGTSPASSSACRTSAPPPTASLQTTSFPAAFLPPVIWCRSRHMSWNHSLPNSTLQARRDRRANEHERFPYGSAHKAR